MLVLSRRVGERILIGDDIVVTVVDVRHDTVRLGIAAPRSVRVNRAEIHQAVAEANRDASRAEESAVAAVRSLRRPGRPDAEPAAPSATATLAHAVPRDPEARDPESGDRQTGDPETTARAPSEGAPS